MPLDSTDEGNSQPENRQSTRSGGKRTFNQTERITTRLKDLVRSYPKGLALIKEFLQNADDAGATDLRVIYDRRTHTGSFQDSPGMEVALGPALLFFNDRWFTEEDFDGIQRIGEGSKARDAARTGRFGQGFNTCYSVSDHPSLMTRIRVGVELNQNDEPNPVYETGIAWFDPHQRVAFQDEGDIKQNAYAWDLWYAQERWHDWVKTFAPAPPHKHWDSKSDEFPGTVFRLPLRSAEDVQNSEILKETFLDQHFDEILKEIQKVGPALLVFLRSVLSLEIREIDVNGNDHLRYWIATSGDGKEVSEKRKVLRDAVHGNPQECLEQWKKSQESLPIVQFDHPFFISDIDGTEREETWAVTTGLFRGTDDALLDAALKVWQHEEKAIPWAGAAFCKNSTSTAQRGGLACFLPLPEEINRPVWLHGWFDLHSSRKGITRTRDVGETTEARYAWNRALMEHAVGPAWALLIEQIRGSAEEQTKPYDLWPRAEYARDELDQALLTGFYRTAADLPVIRGRDANGYRWHGLNDEGVYSLPNAWHNRLLDPLLAEGWILIDPQLSSWAKSGFEKIHAHRTILTPEDIRQALRMDHDIACTLEQAPRPALRRHDWICVLGEFCAEGEWNWLYHLPFALLADGLLHTFTKCGPVYWANDDQRPLLEPLPTRLLNVDEYQSKLRLPDTNTVGVYKLDLGTLIDCIKEVLEKAQDKLNTQWLSAVFNYLANRPSEEIDQHNKYLQELSIIPTTNYKNEMNWYQMGKFDTPLIPDDVDKPLQHALARLKIPLLDGPRELIQAITHFAQCHEGKLIRWLTPQDLADTLTTFDEENDATISKALDDPNVLYPLIDFLASKQWLYSNNKRWAGIKQLRILPTTCKNRVSADMELVYIPENKFTPPQNVISAQYRLLYTGPNDRWREFYNALKIESLNGTLFLQEIFLPFMTQPLPPERRLDYLKWLRDNLRGIEGAAYGQCQSLRKKLHETPFLPLKDGRLAAPVRVYHPNSGKDLEPLLGETLFRTPDMKLFKHQREPWMAFFTELKLPTAPLAEDLFAAIKNLVDEAQKARKVTTNIRDRLKKLFDYIKNHWSDLFFRLVGDNKTFSNALAELAWLPALPKAESNAKYAVAYPAEDRLYKASELIPPGRTAHLVGFKYPILDGPEPPTEIATALRIRTSSSLTLNEVLDHFNAIRALPKPGDTVQKAAIECYRFFGEQAAHSYQFLNRLKQQECVYVDGRWYRPDRCFFNRLPFKTRWAISLSNADLDFDTSQVMRTGLSNIGVRSEPCHLEWSLMLRELREEYDRNPLNPDDLHEVRQALHQIIEKAPTEWLKKCKDLPLPLIDERLEEARLTFIADDPRLERLTPLNLLPLIESNHDAQEIGRIVGAPSLSASLHERLKEQPVEEDSEDRANYIEKMQVRIKTEEFYECLRRLAYHEALNKKHVVDPREAAYSEYLTKVRSLRLRAASAITVESFVNWNGKPLTVFEQKAASFFEKEKLIVWLSSTGKNPRTGDELIEVICDMTELTSKFQLRRVLDCQPKDMLDSLNDDDIAKLPQAQQLILDDLETEQTITRPAPEPIAQPIVPPARPATPPAPINPSTVLGTAERPNTTPGTLQEKPYSADPVSSRQDDNAAKSSSTDAERKDSVRRPVPTGDPPTSQGRAVTYPHPESQSDYDADEDSAFDAKGIGDRGEELVEVDEKSQGRVAYRMGTNHKGYDLESTFQGETRYIEVKSTRGAWGNRGVPVSHPQYEAALQYGEAWWLYVVEYVDNADQPPVIHRIPNPFNRVTEFRFDGGWRSFTADHATESKSMAGFIPGAKIDCGPFGHGTIIELKTVNDAMVLVVDFDSGGSRPIPFKPEMIKLIT